MKRPPLRVEQVGHAGESCRRPRRATRRARGRAPPTPRGARPRSSRSRRRRRRPPRGGRRAPRRSGWWWGARRPPRQRTTLPDVQVVRPYGRRRVAYALRGDVSRVAIRRLEPERLGGRRAHLRRRGSPRVSRRSRPSVPSWEEWDAGPPRGSARSSRSWTARSSAGRRVAPVVAARLLSRRRRALGLRRPGARRAAASGERCSCDSSPSAGARDLDDPDVDHRRQRRRASRSTSRSGSASSAGVSGSPSATASGTTRSCSRRRLARRRLSLSASAVPASEDDAGVVAAEAERVRDTPTSTCCLARLVRDVVEVALRVRRPPG